MPLQDDPDVDKGFAELAESLPKVKSLASVSPEKWFSLSSTPRFPASSCSKRCCISLFCGLLISNLQMIIGTRTRPMTPATLATIGSVTSTRSPKKGKRMGYIGVCRRIGYGF